MKIKSIAYLVLFLAFSISLNAQLLETAKPESVGLSSTQLEHIDALCQEYLDNNWLPGGTVLVARKGKIAYFKTWGTRDVNTKAAYQKEDIFRLASMTKAFTSVAILQLLEQGKILLDDPIANYIPAFSEMQVLTDFNATDTTYTSVKAKNSITIRQLITHTTGISYAFMSPQVAAIYTKSGMGNFGLSHPEATTAEMVQLIAEQPLFHEPGERFTYGYNMEVLGYLVEVVTGKTLGEYCEAHIFEPLGMEDTGFYIAKEKGNRLVPVYYDVPAKKQLFQHTDPIYNYPLWGRTDHFAGGGGASSTTKDYAIFCQALLNGGTYNGKRILGRKTVEFLQEDQLQFMDAKAGDWLGKNGDSFGLGFGLKTEKSEAYTFNSAGAFSWGGIFNTKYWIDPKEELVFVGMTQILPNYHPEFWDKLYNIVYASLE